MASDPESVVREMLAIVYDRGPADELFARTRPLLHPDAEYVNPPDAIESGTRRGYDGWRTVIASLREGLGPEASFEVIEMVPRGEKVFVRARVRTGTERGLEVAGLPLGVVWTVREGLVRRMEWRWDPEEARALFEDAG